MIMSGNRGVNPRSVLMIMVDCWRQAAVSDEARLRELRTSVLPSGWTPLALVNHLALDVEAFWFRAERYRAEAARADAILDAAAPDAAPAWWPDFFGDHRLADVYAVVLHVDEQTAVHLGHLDVVRELIDGRQRLVMG